MWLARNMLLLGYISEKDSGRKFKNHISKIFATSSYIAAFIRKNIYRCTLKNISTPYVKFEVGKVLFFLPSKPTNKNLNRLDANNNP